MNIKILGNGGANSKDLAYNSFLINDYFLAETPPDIMNSLFRENIDISKLKMIFISHFHADHYFGFPLLALRLFTDGRKDALKVLGPGNVKEKIKEICITAFGGKNPLNKWVENSISTVELCSNSEYEIEGGLILKTITMTHDTETYGFSLIENNELIFSYFADTVWNEGLLSVIKANPKIILTDLNGEANDPAKVHLSADDIMEKTALFANNRTVYYGTHLQKDKKALSEKIRFVQAGDIIQI